MEIGDISVKLSARIVVSEHWETSQCGAVRMIKGCFAPILRVLTSVGQDMTGHCINTGNIL